MFFFVEPLKLEIIVPRDNNINKICSHENLKSLFIVIYYF